MESSPGESSIASEPNDAVYFDGASSRRHLVRLALSDRLEIDNGETTLAAWPFADIRRADGAAGTLRLSCLSAPSLARLEIRDPAIAARVIARCSRLDDDVAGRHGIAAIVGWSLAAAISIIAIVLFGVPLVADRLAPLVPDALEHRIGDAGEVQIKAAFGGKTCGNAAGQAAFNKLVGKIIQASGVQTQILTEVLSTPVPNAFALPGGKVFLLDGLLAKAENADEIAGVLAHELGHVRHRDGMRNMIHNGGTSFLIGLLFGDVTGSGALIIASRSLVAASYSREAEEDADSFSIEVMHKLGRPTRSMGDLIFRITGKEAGNGLSILASHPLTEDRLKRMSEEDRPPSGRPLLTAVEWSALKAICNRDN